MAISFWPPDGHIRILMTQESGRKSNWHKRLVKAKVWNKAKPFGILGEPCLFQYLTYKCLPSIRASDHLFIHDVAGLTSRKLM